MAIEARLPDGTTLQFPDGTPDAVVDGAVKQHLSGKPADASQTPESKLGLTPAPPETPKQGAPIDFANRPAAPSPSQEELGIPLPQTTTTPAAPSPPPPDPMRLGPANRPLDAPSLEFHPFAPPRPGALGRIGQAAEAGAQSVPALPRVPAYLAPTFVNQLISGLEGGIRLGSGLFRGGQQATAEMIDPILPGLGGEIAALPEAFAGSPHPTGIPEPPGPRIAPPTGRFVYETYGERGTPPPSGGPPPFLPPGTLQSVQLNQLMDAIRAVDQKAANKPPFIPPTTSTDVMGNVTPIQQPRIPAQPPPAPAAPPPTAPPPTGAGTAPPGAPGPASVGAAASREGTPASQVNLTPEQQAAAGSTADKQWLYSSPTPGEVQDIQYVKGINPTMAQREQTVMRSREMKELGTESPEAEQAARDLATEHSNLRKADFQEIAGSDVTQQADLKAANDKIDTALNAAYSHGGQVDVQPVLDAINTERNAPSGKLPPVKAAMNEIEQALQKSDGSGLETDPRQVNGARRVILFLQSKAGRAANPAYGDATVQAALVRLKQAFDGAIEPAAPGFKQANSDYAAARQAIDAREALQEAEPKLYGGAFNQMTYAPMHRLMGEIIASRDPSAPLNAWQSLTEDQMNRLKSLHDDLRRVATADELAKAKGSDTTQLMSGLLRKAVQGGAGGAAGTIVGGILHASPFTAPIAVPAGMFTKSLVDRMFSRRAQAQAQTQMNQLLRPDPAQYPVKPNPLMQPPEGPP